MPLSLEQIQEARQRISPFIRKTPLIRAYALEQFFEKSPRIFLKCENLQITNSFKLRGAFNALLKLSHSQKQLGVVTRSSGNFAQALAYAARFLKIPVYIIMPTSVPAIKRELTERQQAHVLLFGTEHAEQQQKVQELAKDKNLTPFSPYDHIDVVEGQGTLSLEVYDVLPSLSRYFCPIGGGGLSGGTSTALKGLRSSIRITGVEPTGANDYFLSRQQGKRVKNQQIHTIADGLRAPQVGDCNWPLLQSHIDNVVCVTDEQIKHAMFLLYEKLGLIIEPSGAASVAGLLLETSTLEGDIVCVLSGANVDREDFDLWIEEGRNYHD